VLRVLQHFAPSQLRQRLRREEQRLVLVLKFASI
jgi:hypothetical protein